MDGGFERVEISEAGLAARKMALEFFAGFSAQVAIQIFGERGKDSFTAWVRHCVSRGAGLQPGSLGSRSVPP